MIVTLLYLLSVALCFLAMYYDYKSIGKKLGGPEWLLILTPIVNLSVFVAASFMLVRR